MIFHYEKQHKELSLDCPPKDYAPLEIQAYRWVFDENDARNFQSQYEKDMNRPIPPKRYNDMNDVEKCERMALSMFNSLEAAQRQFVFYAMNSSCKIRLMNGWASLWLLGF